MKKTIELSVITYEKFFAPLQEIYKWNIKVGNGVNLDRVHYKSIETEEPILKEIKVAMETQIAYSKQIIKQIKEAY